MKRPAQPAAQISVEVLLQRHFGSDAGIELCRGGFMITAPCGLRVVVGVEFETLEDADRFLAAAENFSRQFGGGGHASGDDDFACGVRNAKPKPRRPTPLKASAASAPPPDAGDEAESTVVCLVTRRSVAGEPPRSTDRRIQGRALTDAEFAEAAGNGFRRTVAYLMKRGGLSREDAEEFAQDGWLKAWDRRRKLRDKDALQAWANQIAYNEFMNTLRRRRIRVVQLGQPDPGYTPEFERALEVERTTIEAKRLLELLPPRPRYAVRCVYIDECARPTVAAKMRISRNALNKIVKRAFRRLRKKLNVPQPRPLPRKVVGRQERAIQKALTSK